MILLPILLLTIFCNEAAAQRSVTMRLMSWNVENLFDTRHDEGKQDYDFTPEGTMRWNGKRLMKKVRNIASVVAAVGDSLPPDIIGMCEVENDSVMTLLTRTSGLRELGYHYIMTSSADRRGIDVALLYRRNIFRPIGHQCVRTEDETTRDILYVCGEIISGDTLDIIVTHLPSRRGGAHASEPRRIAVAKRIRQLADSVVAVRAMPRIIIMGDFNDYPNNRSVKEIIGARSPKVIYASDSRTDSTKAINAEANSTNTCPASLYNLFLASPHTSDGHGSYKHNGVWGFLDQIIVSGLLLDSAQSIYTSPDRASEVRLPFILTDDTANGGTKPLRTYNGYKYVGGYSDHLPVRADFTVTLPF